MDTILIHNLEFFAAVGVSEAEREVGQWLVATVAVRYDLRAAGQSDDLADTISYSDLARTVQRVGTECRCKLLEFMAEQIARAVLDTFPVEEVRVQLLKKPPPTAMLIEKAGVEIRRRRGAGG